ncbi:MAG: PipA/GogA/GtgA family type III secretion system effector [Janthinobacterium lividum]
MLWIKVVSALESALLFTSSSATPQPPAARARQTSSAAAPPRCARAHHGGGTAGGTHHVLPDGARDDATTGVALLRAVRDTGPVPPGWGLTRRARAAAPTRQGIDHRTSPAAPRGADRPEMSGAPAPSSLPGTFPGVTSPDLQPLATPRTVWTHDLTRTADNLTQTPWKTSRHVLGDDLWTSAGIAAWWSLKFGLAPDEAASLLHRARALAYGAFEVPGAREGIRTDWAQLHERERTILNAWIHTRLALARAVHEDTSGHTARATLMQLADSTCRGRATPASLETLYLLVMADDISLRYNVDEIRRQYDTIWNPSLALAMASYVSSTVLPKVDTLDDITRLPTPVQRGLDEAALLYFTVEHTARQAWSIACPSNQPSRAALRSAFVALMPAEKRDLELLDQLFQPPCAPERIHYDGITLRNALGLTFDDLLKSEEMHYPPGMSELPPARQRKLLARKFAQLHLSPRYPFGSVRHAITATVEYITRYLGDRAPNGIDNDTCLLNAFQKARLAWNDAKDGPSSPDLMLAGQLSASNGVRLETTATLRTWFDTEIIAPFRRISEQMRAAGVQGTSPYEWLQQNIQQRRDENRPVPGGTLPDEYQWALDTLRQQRSKIAHDAASYFFSPYFPESSYPASRLSQAPFFKEISTYYAAAFSNVDPAELKREILVGNTWQERGEVALVYANERMLATFGRAPTLDLAAIAVDKLAAAGLNDAEIRAIHRIEIEGNDTELREPITGSYVDAFLHVCRQISAARHFFLPSGHRIRPLDLIAPAVRDFNARLPSDPWIRVAALETFRCAGIVPSSYDLRDAIDRKVREHRIASPAMVLLNQVLDVRNLIPFYASSQAIHQGLTEKRYYQVLFGVINMVGEGASFIHTQLTPSFPRSLFTAARPTPAVRRGSALSLSDSVSAFCSWPPSFNAFQDLKPWQELIRPPERLFDADLRLLPVYDRRPLRLLPDAMLPWGAREPAARARAGERHVTWNDLNVVFCPRENTTFLARHEREEYYAKIDWFTLQPTEPPEFIQQDEDGEFHPIESILPSDPSAFGEFFAPERSTVQQVVLLLDNATDGAPRAFRNVFNARFDIAYTAAAQTLRKNHPSRAYDLLDFLQNAYTHSAIVRRVFHRFVDTAADRRSIPVSVDCGTVPMNAVSRTASGAVATINAVRLPADRDDASLRYQSVRGIEPPMLERTILHEFFHAWTRMPDPSFPDERHHRGAIVWLAETALRQMGHPVHPRIAYGLWDERLAAYSDTYQKTILWSGMEDRLIEQVVPGLDLARRISMAYGVSVERRVTVGQVLSLLRPASANDTRAAPAAPSSTLASWFASNIETRDARAGTTSAHQTRFNANVHLLIRHCEVHSPLLQRLLAANPVDPTQTWHFRLEDRPPSRDEDGQQLYEVDFFNRQVVLLSGIASYLSHGGIRPLPLEMRILAATIALLTEKKAPAREASPYLDRGAVVWLTDRILAESGYDFPKRLHRAMLFDKHGQHYRQALNEFARARWAAEIEDRYLADRLSKVA